MHRSAIVAQIFNLPFRRLAVCEVSKCIPTLNTLPGMAPTFNHSQNRPRQVDRLDRTDSFRKA
jgi:hypothetical protein